MRAGTALIFCCCLPLIAARAQDEPRPVTVAEAERAPTVRRLELTGTVSARRRSLLSPRIAGLIERMHVDAGDVVKRGDPVMELDAELAEIALEQTLLELERAKIEREEAARRVEEVRELAERGGFSRSEAETRRTALLLAEVAVRRWEVARKEQEERLERHRLAAPFAGVIAEKRSEDGEWVETGAPVVELVETEGLRLDVQVPQETFVRLVPGTNAAVRLDAYPTRELAATVRVRVPVKDPAARTALVRLALEDPDGLAAPGMSARVVFSLGDESEVVRVPRDAVVRLPDGSVRVWTVEKAEQGGLVARSRPVTPGTLLAERVELLGGLEAGATVVVRGNETLREGQAVEILATERVGKP